MMETVVMIIGVAKLTSWLFDLVDLIERPTKKAPCINADQSQMQEAS